MNNWKIKNVFASLLKDSLLIPNSVRLGSGMVLGLLYGSCSRKQLEVGCFSVNKKMLEDLKPESLGVLAGMNALVHCDTSRERPEPQSGLAPLGAFAPR